MLFPKAYLDSLKNEFRQKVCETRAGEMAEIDWYAMSLGWFLAKGLNIETAHAVAREVKYAE